MLVFPFLDDVRREKMLRKNTWGITIKVQDGHLTIRVSAIENPLPLRFIGHTGKGVFPETGGRYQEFFCTPEPNDRQMLVFKQGGSYRLFTILWKSGKMECREGYDLPVSVQDHSSCLQAQVSGHTYTTDKTKTVGRYRLVDEISLLQHLEGRISSRTLARRARNLVAEDEHCDVQIRYFETEIQNKDEELEKLRGELEELRSRPKSFWSRPKSFWSRVWGFTLPKTCNDN